MALAKTSDRKGLAGFRQGLRPEKLVEFLEAVYALEREDEPWLRGVSLATREVWGRPAPIFSSFFDATDPRQFRPTLVVTDGVSDALAAAFFRTIALVSPAIVARVFRRFVAGTLRRAAPELAPGFAETEPLGVGDGMAIVGVDPNGLGCSVALVLPRPYDAPPEELSILRRMANHVGAAFRCRLRLAAEQSARARVDLTAGAEAVLNPAGKVLHAEGSARTRAAQESLKDALRAFDRARTRGGARKAIAAIQRHRPLVDARWTLVDTYERDGARFVVARENEAAVRGLKGLTARERQVAAFLALGHSTKEVAYELGISDSTTRVLLSRAITKIGVKTRQELIGRVTREALPELEALEEPALRPA
jgi:DNA-binding CsgD family transcriptional regulator